MDSAQLLITLGSLFLVGLFADLIGRSTFLPRVTLLILMGVILGPEALDFLPSFSQQIFPLITNIALAFIGFELGKSLTRKNLYSLGRPILSISISVMLLTAFFIFFGLYLLGVPAELALILAGIAPATAPGPVIDSIDEINSCGPYTNTLMGVVAVDDAWGMLLFSLLLIFASISIGNGAIGATLLHGIQDVFGAALLGVMVGIPMAILTSRLYPGRATQAEAIGFVMLGAGLAIWLNVSYILTTMIMGIIIANLSKHHAQRPFKELEKIQWPILILFFLLAGASLQFQALWQAGIIGLAYVVLRVLGRIVGSWIGSRFAHISNPHYQWMGLAMLPHAGVPIGMALIAIQVAPDYEESILAIILGATIIFEIIGPILTRHMLKISGEAKLKP